MKTRVLAILVVLTMLTTLPLTATASAEEDVAYDIGYLSICLPADFLVFTRENLGDDHPAAAQLDMEAVRDQFDAYKEFYLDGYQMESGFEIVVQVDPSGYHTDYLQEAGPSFLDDALTKMADNMHKNGVEITEREIKRLDHGTYLFFHGSLQQNGSDVSMLRYVTVAQCAGIYYGVSIEGYLIGQEITDEMARTLLGAVQSIEFAATDAQVSGIPTTQVISHCENGVTLSLTVPIDWCDVGAEESERVSDLEWGWIGNQTLSTLNVDCDAYWSEMPLLDKVLLGFPTSGKGMNLTEEGAFAQYLRGQLNGGYDEDFEPVTIGGVTYFHAIRTPEKSGEQGVLNMNTAIYVTVQEGTIYYIQFRSTDQAPFTQEEITDIMQSVTYTAGDARQ